MPGVQWPAPAHGGCGTSAKGTASQSIAAAPVWPSLPRAFAVVRYALANIGPLSINIDAIPMQAYGGGLFTVSTCHSFFRAINRGLVAFLCATSVPEEKWTEASF